MKIIRKNGFDEVFPYIAYVPDKLSGSPALLIQLHGSAERGNGEDELDRVLIHGFPNTVNDDNLKDCVLVMPQCPEDTFWAAKIETVKSFTEQMMKKFSADENRIYLCGMSMGGYGTWHAAAEYPEMFAAIAPCCGGGEVQKASRITMPVWAFHGLEDKAVEPSRTIEMVEALKGVNPNVKCDLYEGVGHASWHRAFCEETLEWLLSKKKA